MVSTVWYGLKNAGPGPPALNEVQLARRPIKAAAFKLSVHSTAYSISFTHQTICATTAPGVSMPAQNLHIFVSSAPLIAWDRATQATDEIVGLHKQRSSRKLSEGGFDPAAIAVVPTW